MIGAVVLAAGLSKRMGQPKMVMQWGSRTVISQVVATILESNVQPVVVVTGAARQQVAAALVGQSVLLVYNPTHANGEMMCSFQVGLRAMPAEVESVLLALGDQPQIQVETIQALLRAFMQETAPIIIPSFNMRRGHPWLIRRDLWVELLEMAPPATLHDFIQAHNQEICHVRVDSPTILLDLDTPEDYLHQRPG